MTRAHIKAFLLVAIIGVALFAAFVFAEVFSEDHGRDGRTPQTAVRGTDVSQSTAPQDSKRETLGPTDLIWLPELPTSRRCYLSLTIPDTITAFVTVPENWCDRMRSK